MWRPAQARALGGGRRLGRRTGARRLRRLQSGPVADKPDNVVERRIVAQLQRIITLDPIRLTNRREHLRLLDRIDPQIRLEIEIHVKQIRRITRLLSNYRQHTRLDLAVRRRGNDRRGLWLRRGDWLRRGGRGRCGHRLGRGYGRRGGRRRLVRHSRTLINDPQTMLDDLELSAPHTH